MNSTCIKSRIIQKLEHRASRVKSRDPRKFSRRPIFQPFRSVSANVRAEGMSGKVEIADCIHFRVNQVFDELA